VNTISSLYRGGSSDNNTIKEKNIQYIITKSMHQKAMIRIEIEATTIKVKTGIKMSKIG